VIDEFSVGFVHKRLFGAARGFVGGGFAGAAKGFILPPGGAGGSVSQRAPQPDPFAFGKSRSLGKIPVLSVPGFRGMAQRAVPGGATGLEVAFPATGGCPSGFHPNKSTYMTAEGLVEKGTKCVRNRRRNLSNGRANTRSLRRMAAWDKQERKLGRILKSIARGR